MIFIPPSKIEVWPQFALGIKTPLSFEADGIYHLCGPNGSGKTSFITQILISKLKQAGGYILYIEQQLDLQLYAIKAYAAIMHKDHLIRNEADLQQYLIQNLSTAYSAQPREIYLIADESHELNHLLDLCQFAPHALIFTSHHSALPGAVPINFCPISASFSEVYAPD